MFEKIPTIHSSQELLDIAFKRTQKVAIHDREIFYKKKKTTIAKIDSFTQTITATLERYVKEFPSLDQLPTFYQEIINVKINSDKLKKSLGGVDWARKTIQKIYTSQIKNIRKSGNLEFIQQKQKEIYGRISSIVKQIKKELETLSEAQKIMKQIPGIRDIPTVVIAGYPNVGKSSLLTSLSKAKPHIAQYPFTTKELHVGHITHEEHYQKTTFQIIDTPGLLDRPMEKRNEIEHEAILALRHLADIIIFIFDPSETCGFKIEDQKNLFNDMKDMFSDSIFIVVENKKDIFKTKNKNHKVSTKNNEGIEELRKKIIKEYKKINSKK